MSTPSSPEEEFAVDASVDPASDGGNSSGLRQGEIIFVTMLSFFVLLGIIMGTYAMWRHRRRKEVEQKEADERQRTDLTIDIEAGEMHIKGGDSEKTSRRDSLSQQDSERHSRRGSRRASEDSSNGRGNIQRYNRRATVEIGSGHGMDGTRPPERHRRATMSSLGSNVSAGYKLAAIDHMNQISQSGVHE